MTSRRYLVELANSPGLAPGELANRAKDGNPAAAGRFIRSLYVPEDDRWFLLYEGDDPRAIADAARRLGLDVLGVDAALTLT